MSSAVTTQTFEEEVLLRAIQIALQSGEAPHAPTEAVERLAGLVAALADHLDIIERRTQQ